MIHKLPTRIILFCLILFHGSLAVAYAQGPTGEDEETTATVVPPAGQLDLTFKELGYDNHQLDGDEDQLSYRVELPGNFEISPIGNYLDLVTSHLLRTPGLTASLEIIVNGLPISTVNLGASNAVSETTRIDLPEGVIQKGRNTVDITLDTGQTCEDTGAMVDVVVDNSSLVNVDYQQNSYVPDLGLYPSPFVEQNLLQIPVTIVLPDQPTSNDLSVAATIAAGLGSQSNGNINLTAIPAGNIDVDLLSTSHLIVVGQPDKNSLLGDLDLPLALDSSTLDSGQGILQEIVSPWNQFRLVLVVSALDDEGIIKAGTVLNRQVNFLGMRGPVAIVLDVLPLPKSEESHEASITLASLGYDDEIVYGAAPRSYSFWFELPPGWRLEDSPFFALKFAHADSLDPYQSVMDVKLNDVPVGSTLLDESNVDNGELVASLPINLLRTGLNRVQVDIEMSLVNGDKCQDEANERAWTVISNQSEIFLPYNALDFGPSLRHFPYPFSEPSGFAQTLLVLPDQATDLMLNDVMQLAVQMGRSTKPENISPRIAFANQVDETLLEDHHLILLGLPTENLLLQEANQYLPQPFLPNSNALEPLVVDNVALVSDPDRDAGLLQMTTSPWNDAYNLLAITGTSEEGYKLTFQPLLNATWRLNGNLAVIEPVIVPNPDDSNQVDVFATYIQSPASTDSEASVDTGDTNPEDSLSLAKRWWK